MEPPKIERRKVITVAHAQLNSYGDLLVTDTENNEHKIGKKRAQLHELFQTDAVIELGYASYMDREYIAVAHPFEGQIPKEQEPKEPPKEHVAKAAKQADTDWAKKDTERNRSMCISYAKDLAVADKIEVSAIVEFADIYLHYIEKGEQ